MTPTVNATTFQSNNYPVFSSYYVLNSVLNYPISPQQLAFEVH